MMRKVLIRVEVVLCGLMLFFSIALILFKQILPSQGIIIYYNVAGTSMNPTITDSALIAGVRTPYEEL